MFQHKQKTENVPWLCQAEKNNVLLLQNINVLVLASKHQCFVFWLQNINVLVSVSKHQCFCFGEEIDEVTKPAAQCQEPKICLRSSLSNIFA